MFVPGSLWWPCPKRSWAATEVAHHRAERVPVDDDVEPEHPRYLEREQPASRGPDPCVPEIAKTSPPAPGISLISGRLIAEPLGSDQLSDERHLTIGAQERADDDCDGAAPARSCDAE